MTAIAELDAAATAQWDDYVRKHAQSSPWHLSHWGPLIEQLFGHRHHNLLARDDDGRVCGVLPIIEMKSLLFGHFMCSMPYFNYGGVLADDEHTARRLIEAGAARAKDCKVSHLELRHIQRCAPELPAQTRKVAMWLDLPESPEALFDSLPAKLRSQVRRPGKAGAVATSGGPELLDAFYQVFCRNMRDLGTPVYPRSFFQRIVEAAADARIVLVTVEDKPAAAAILVGHGERIEIPWASANRDYNRISVNMLLYWEALKTSIEAGYRIFDFGRSTQGEGTWRFKKQWGTREVPLHWEYWLPDGGSMPSLNPDNPKFALAVKAWQRLPLWLANLIGPWIVRNIP